MLEEAIDKILSLRKFQTEEINGRTYSDAELKPIMEPLPRPLEIKTLDGLIRYVESEKDFEKERVFIHALGPRNVQVVSPILDTRRILYASVEACTGWSELTEGMTHEDFVVTVASMCVQTPERNALLEAVAAIKLEDAITTEDDGLSQTVSKRAGIAVIERKALPPVIKLAPYRTFLEVEQPESSFLLRMSKSSSGMVTLRLREVDGGAWKIQALKNIRKYLVEKMPWAERQILA